MHELFNKKIIFRLFVWSFWIIGLSYFFYEFGVYVHSKNKLRHNIYQISSNNILIKNKTDSLMKLIKLIKTDNFTVEKVAREKLGMALPSEEIIRFKIEK